MSRSVIRSNDKVTLLIEANLPTADQVYLYVGGLQSHLQKSVIMDKPRTLRQAKELAEKHEMLVQSFGQRVNS